MEDAEEASVSSELLPAPEIFFKPADADDLNAIAALEAAGYPPDEAASRDQLASRIQLASGQFLAAVRSGEDGASAVIGFCCGTLSNGTSLTHDSMSVHEPDGVLLCIHSVCVADGQRRQGLATRLLRAYINFVQQTTPQLQEIRLICKEPLVGLYQRAGFTVVGPSPVVHGQDPWIEMAQEA